MSMMLPVKILPPAPNDATSQGAPTSPPQRFLIQEKDQQQLNTKVACLILGVSAFGQGLEDLPGAPRDTYRLFLELSNSQKYEQTSVRPVTNPTREQTVLALQEWCKDVRASNSQTALLYISTHGCYIEGTYHLCMSDSSYKKRAYTQTLSWTELRTWLAPLQDRTVVVMLDSCRQQTSSQRSSSTPIQRDDVTLRGENWAVYTAATFGSVAQEFTEKYDGSYGLFTYALLQSLQGWRQDIPIRLQSLHTAIKENLHQQAQQLQLPVQQEPRLYIGHMDIGEKTILHPTKGTQRTKRERGIPLAIGLALCIFLLGGWFWSNSQKPEKIGCTSCLQQHWMHLRQRDCKTLQPLPSPITLAPNTKCTLPCNQENLKATIRQCSSACASNRQDVHKQFRTLLERQAPHMSLSQKQCVALLPTVQP